MNNKLTHCIFCGEDIRYFASNVFFDSSIDNRKIEFGWVEHKRCVDKKVIPLETQLKYFSWVDINFEDLYEMRETYKLHNYIFPEDDFQILLQMICKTEDKFNVVYPGE